MLDEPEGTELRERCAVRAVRLSVRWDTATWGAWGSTLAWRNAMGEPVREEDGPCAVPCEEAEAVLAGWRGQDMGPCEEAEAVLAGWRGQGMGPCEEAEAVLAGW